MSAGFGDSGDTGVLTFDGSWNDDLDSYDSFCAAGLNHVTRSGERPKLDVWVEHGEERIEVAFARRGEKRVDDGALRCGIGVRGRHSAADSAAGAARKLPCCFR